MEVADVGFLKKKRYGFAQSMKKADFFLIKLRGESYWKCANYCQRLYTVGTKRVQKIPSQSNLPEYNIKNYARSMVAIAQIRGSIIHHSQ